MIIGIDPGQTGALALLTDGELIDILDMPIDEDGQVDGLVINRFINRHQYREAGLVRIASIWIERVHSMPQQGVASMFKFGLSYGIAIGASEASGASINYARPQDWKKHFGLSADKNESLELARELFPDDLDRFVRKKDNGRAEATLIALYGLEHTTS